LRDIRKYITVRVRISKGSSFYEIYLKEALNAMVDKISGNQAVFLLALSVLTVGGYWFLGRILDYKKEIIKQAEDKKTSVQIVETLTPLIDKSLGIIQKADLE
jgi:hypothetical protein